MVAVGALIVLDIADHALLLWPESTAHHTTNPSPPPFGILSIALCLAGIAVLGTPVLRRRVQGSARPGRRHHQRASRSAPLELDGCGGAGLLGMTERAKAHGGQLSAGPVPGGGWRVTASLLSVARQARRAMNTRKASPAIR